jgi:hypothetical protein
MRILSGPDPLIARGVRIDPRNSSAESPEQADESKDMERRAGEPENP